ncbi:MAG: hypothetical protein ACREBQ_08745, partial [Nitrososphaerales archaeon]
QFSRTIQESLTPSNASSAAIARVEVMKRRGYAGRNPLGDSRGPNYLSRQDPKKNVGSTLERAGVSSVKGSYYPLATKSFFESLLYILFIL